MSGVAVVADGWLVGPAPLAVKLPAPWQLADVLGAAVAGDVDVVMVHAGEVGWDGQLQPGWDVVGEVDGAPWWVRRGGGDAVAFLCGPGAQGAVRAPRVAVLFLGRDVEAAAGDWAGLNPRQLLDSLGQLQRLLGVPWAGSVGLTAERLIMATHPRQRGGRRLDPEPATPEPVDNGFLELPWAKWRRDLAGGELDGEAWVHVFDANAQYLSAWIAAELGHGEPARVGRGWPAAPNAVGVWRVPGLGESVLPGKFGRLPAPWIRGREWFTGPTLRRAVEVADELGVELPTPVEGWVWPERSRFLRAAGERLRDARREARAAHAAAGASLRGGADDLDVEGAVRRFVVSDAVLGAVKALYTRQTGRFNMAARDRASGWRRPDWGHTVRATARCNLHRALSSLAVAPVAIATDALIFVHYEPDPVVFASMARLRVGEGLGEFKHEGSVRAGDVEGLGELAGQQLVDAIAKAAAANG